ncbi:MAG: RnfABCDGE type electron transport complex subunit G [Tissierellia bacterium]|nr:RnfABCDGE type electron transport complex subunit G [Tissierellia bacterium]
MKESFVLAAKLFIITAVSALILSLVNSVTEPVIAQRELEEYNRSLAEVYPDADDFETIGEDEVGLLQEKDEQIEDVVKAKQGENTIGWVVKANGKGGYGGSVEIVVGVNQDKEIVGYKILKSQETPGIGDKIGEEEFIHHIIGTSVENEVIAVKQPSAENEIMTISGATYSSNAVLNGINATVNALTEVMP